MKRIELPDFAILRMLVDEHQMNHERDMSYAALNCELDAPVGLVEDVVLFFLERLIIDGVVNADKVRRVATFELEVERPGFAYRE